MSTPMPDPYRPPLAESKLTSAEAADIKHRDILTGGAELPDTPSAWFSR